MIPGSLGPIALRGPGAGRVGTAVETHPLVSIVTPSLNQGRFIAAALESVRAQDYPRIEHIVVDGGSTDRTLAVLAAQSPGLRWVSQPDSGQSAAINRGFRMAGGQIMSWLNADDMLHPGAVRAVVEEFQADPEAMMVYGQADFTDATGLPVESLRPVEPFNLDRLIDVHAYIVQPAAFVRREALAAVGYVDETLHWSMDWDLWIRIGQRFPVRYMPIPLATVRLHADAKTCRAGVSKLREMHRLVRRHSRRRFPPLLLIQGGGTLYRMARRLVGAPVPMHRPPALVRWVCRRLSRVIETGRFPWERLEPGLRRPGLVGDVSIAERR